MRFYDTQHQAYCGVELHARSMNTHILDTSGKTVCDKDEPAAPEALLVAVGPSTRGNRRRPDPGRRFGAASR